MENSERDGNTRPPNMPLEKSVCRSRATVRTGHGTMDWFQIWKGVCQGCILSPCSMQSMCVCVCVLSHVQLFATPWTIACQASLSMEFSRQEYWSGLPFPSPSIQSTSCKMPGWMKHKLESRLPGEISITLDMQMTQHLWQKVKRS